MNLAPAQLSDHLQRGLRSLYTLHGDEPLLVQEFADALRAAARERGYTERTVHTVAGAHFDWSEVLASGGSLSLFADKQIVEIRIPSGKPGKDGSLALQQIAERAQGDDSTLTLVLLPRLDSMTTKGAWFGALESFGTTVKFDAIDRRNLPQWIAQRLQQQGQRVAQGEEGQRTLQFFADRVEGNLLAAHQEIQKLGLLYPTGPGASAELGFDQVENAVLNVARYDVFKLSEAVLGGHALRVQRMLDGLQSEGESEVLVHWALSEDIRSLKRVKDALGAGRPMPMALRENRVWGVKEKLFERVLPQMGETTLANLLHAAHKVDGIVKGLKQPDWPADGWQALQRLAGMVCSACQPSAVARGVRQPLGGARG
ncbi:MAG: DNA polymerase III subunit delta [Polaromonas sp.]|uniref:DNA polymerase III subunit delta n=1 Tax=Polaromonas sp. TaxID=1869339 RepID=UPI002489E024|nr:DNA polymerase III subunit delta [Polaromonas sp.]MDI1236902.1 DNA polymerase III subunit delta [Polaromonas sp.]MDI1340489.1 DNA polymerase III subunit delta [Polaromonas sp.]